MWWWLRRICGGGSAGYVMGEIKNKANSAQLELELGLSLAISPANETRTGPYFVTGTVRFWEFSIGPANKTKNRNFTSVVL